MLRLEATPGVIASMSQTQPSATDNSLDRSAVLHAAVKITIGHNVPPRGSAKFATQKRSNADPAITTHYMSISRTKKQDKINGDPRSKEGPVRMTQDNKRKEDHKMAHQTGAIRCAHQA